jgi:hypothetical protein
MMTLGTGLTLLMASLASAPPGALRCSTGEGAAAELRAAHETDRRAHLEGHAELMAPGMAEEVALVSNGEVSLNRKDKMISFFKGYFARVRYLEWSDAAPPVVKVSPDGRMGWMAVKVRARYLDRSNPEAGQKAFKSSWISTYQRAGCDWKMTGNSSAIVND